MHNFNKQFAKFMTESLIEGESDYSDVMDALKKLEDSIKELVQVYPADRGSHAHAAYRAEILYMVDRINSWTKQQAKFMANRAKDIGPFPKKV